MYSRGKGKEIAMIYRWIISVFLGFSSSLILAKDIVLHRNNTGLRPEKCKALEAELNFYRSLAKHETALSDNLEKRMKHTEKKLEKCLKKAKPIIKERHGQ